MRRAAPSRRIVHLRAGASTRDVLAAFGLGIADLFPESPAPPRSAARLRAWMKTAIVTAAGRGWISIQVGDWLIRVLRLRAV